jgi:hypothetical protein
LFSVSYIYPFCFIYISEYIRGIYNLAGIVFPAILLDGTVVGRWKKDKSKLIFKLFREISMKDRKKITAKAVNVFGNINKTEWIDI